VQTVRMTKATPDTPPERTLLLLRHAKSDWSGGEADIDRTLNHRGQNQATDVGSWLAEQFATIDVAIVSPATRARATWVLVSAEFGDPPETRVDERAYAASVTDLLGIVQELPDDLRTVILVAHNPGLEELVEVLSGESITMPTSGLAVLALPGTWAEADPASASLLAAGRPPARA
jgi:phosphohistidine phosphatase